MIAATMLALAGCGGGDGGSTGNEAAGGPVVTAAVQPSPAPSLPPCPFRNTTGWSGTWEAGWMLVVGRADLMMAGFKPSLTPRPGAAAGTLALDLALRPEAGAGVDDQLRFERRGAPAYARTEIWCGGERIEAFDNVLVAQ